MREGILLSGDLYNESVHGYFATPKFHELMREAFFSRPQGFHLDELEELLDCTREEFTNYLNNIADNDGVAHVPIGDSECVSLDLWDFVDAEEAMEAYRKNRQQRALDRIAEGMRAQAILRADPAYRAKEKQEREQAEVAYRERRRQREAILDVVRARPSVRLGTRDKLSHFHAFINSRSVWFVGRSISISFDNLSDASLESFDEPCRLLTGVGFSVRALRLLNEEPLDDRLKECTPLADLMLTAASLASLSHVRKQLPGLPKWSIAWTNPDFSGAAFPMPVPRAPVGRSYPILVLNGEQGSGKSSFALRLRRLLDAQNISQSFIGPGGAKAPSCVTGLAGLTTMKTRGAASISASRPRVYRSGRRRRLATK
jgi:hypothetical protein